MPDEVVVLITKNGKELLRRELIDNGVWDEMLAEMKREKIGIDGRLVFGETSIRTIPDARGNEIDDLRVGGCAYRDALVLENGEKVDSLYYHESRMPDEVMVEMWIG